MEQNSKKNIKLNFFFLSVILFYLFFWAVLTVSILWRPQWYCDNRDFFRIISWPHILQPWSWFQFMTLLFKLWSLHCGDRWSGNVGLKVIWGSEHTCIATECGPCKSDIYIFEKKKTHFCVWFSFCVTLKSSIHQRKNSANSTLHSATAAISVRHHTIFLPRQNIYGLLFIKKSRLKYVL